MPVKKTKKPRARKAPAKKKGLKQKQKQKQEQKVNVSVSAGGSGGTQFIPMPSAPAFDYAQLAQLIRPAATVDVPIRAQENPEPIAAREASSQTLAQEFPRPVKEKSKSKSKSKQPLYASMSEREAGYETFPSSESEREVREIIRKQEAQSAAMFRKYAESKAKPFIASPSPSDFNIFSDEPIILPASRSGSGQSVRAPTRDLFGSGPSFSSGSD